MNSVSMKMIGWGNCVGCGRRSETLRTKKQKFPILVESVQLKEPITLVTPSGMIHVANNCRENGGLAETEKTSEVAGQAPEESALDKETHAQSGRSTQGKKKYF